MSADTFSLVPFPGRPAPEVQLAAVSRRQRAELLLCFLLRGAIGELVLPEPASAPARRDGLWQESCFELFLAPGGEARYWEVNLSPAGHWNVYAFAGYRDGRRPEPGIESLSCTVVREAESLALTAVLPTGGWLPAGEPLQLGLSAVLQERSGPLSYWALTHPAEQPDFHHRQGFTVTL